MDRVIEKGTVGKVEGDGKQVVPPNFDKLHAEVFAQLEPPRAPNGMLAGSSGPYEPDGGKTSSHFDVNHTADLAVTAISNLRVAQMLHQKYNPIYPARVANEAVTTLPTLTMKAEDAMRAAHADKIDGLRKELRTIAKDLGNDLGTDGFDKMNRKAMTSDELVKLKSYEELMRPQVLSQTMVDNAIAAAAGKPELERLIPAQIAELQSAQKSWAHAYAAGERTALQMRRGGMLALSGGILLNAIADHQHFAQTPTSDRTIAGDLIAPLIAVTKLGVPLKIATILGTHVINRYIDKAENE